LNQAKPKIKRLKRKRTTLGVYRPVQDFFSTKIGTGLSKVT